MSTGWEVVPTISLTADINGTSTVVINNKGFRSDGFSAFSHNFVSAGQLINTSTSTLNITSTSPQITFFTGSTPGFVITMPDVTTLEIGQTYQFYNVSTQQITIQSFDTSLINMIIPLSGELLTCADIIAEDETAWFISYLPTVLAGTAGQVFTSNGTSVAATFQDLPSGFTLLIDPIGSTPNSSGASATGSTLTLEPADATNPGIVSTTTQSFGGAKTFASVTSSSLTNTNGILYSGSAGLISNTTVGTAGQLLTSNGTGVAPTFQTFGGAFTVPTTQLFNVTGTSTGIYLTGTSISASNGDTYTNNSVTYTVTGTVSSSSYIFLSGTGTLSGLSFTRTSGSGTDPIVATSVQATATYTLPTSPSPLYIEVAMIGAGGGGDDTTGNNGGAGTDTVFKNCIAGGCPATSGGNIQTGGQNNSLFTSTITNSQGARGTNGSNDTISNYGGPGAASYYGQGGTSSGTSGNRNAQVYGSGGAGGKGGVIGNIHGGGAGGFLQGIITTPASTYRYCVGTGGLGGQSGTVGGNGGNGYLVVKEYYS